MKGEANENELPDCPFQKGCSQEVERDHIEGMQIMESNAAAPGMKDGRHQQMVQVHSHRRQQDEPASFPVLPVIQVGDQAYGQEM